MALPQYTSWYVISDPTMTSRILMSSPLPPAHPLEMMQSGWCSKIIFCAHSAAFTLPMPHFLTITSVPSKSFCSCTSSLSIATINPIFIVLWSFFLRTLRTLRTLRSLVSWGPLGSSLQASSARAKDDTFCSCGCKGMK